MREADSEGEYHIPVMLQDVLEHLKPEPGMVVVDGTAGSAGHSREFAVRLQGNGLLVALDRDERMLEIARDRLKREFGSSGLAMGFFACSYEEVGAVLAEVAPGRGADAVLLDLGVNSLQIDDAERGFAFRLQGPLDGRFSKAEGGRTMGEVVNTASEKELSGLLKTFGDERLARPIARAIVRRRSEKPFETTTELAELVAGIYPPKERFGRIHPATRTFQALRIFVNDELGAVERGVRACIAALAPGGRLGVISFHSGEDRIVKQLFQEASLPPEDPSNPYSSRSAMAMDFVMEPRKPVACSDEEADRNPRARSAKLRVLRRKAEGEE